MEDFEPMLDKLQANMQEIKQKMSQLQAQGEAGAGLVKVTVNGHKQILAITIDPSLMQPTEQQMLQDLVIGATNKALQAVDGKGKELLQTKAMGMLGPWSTDLFL